MTERPMPPAVTSVEMRLDALTRAVGRVEAILDRAFPAAVEPVDGETIELREPIETVGRDGRPIRGTPKPVKRS